MAREREKRPLEDSTKDGMPDDKRQRPGLASVIVEAVKMDSLQKLCSTLEPLLRRVVGEEVERALAKFTPPKVGVRTSPKRIQGPDQRSLRLQFRNKLALPLFTGSKIEGEQGSSIHVVLVDADTGHVVSGGPESAAKLDVVVLEGDFAADDEENWSQEEFENAEVRERDGKRPLLTGDLTVVLKDGVGSLGDLSFTDNSSWIRSRKFRLGVKISSGFCEGLRIREAKTEAFTVKDHRGELYKKHYPPALSDEVWRLDKIGKDGAFHKRLNQSGIQTVEDFLRLVVMDPQRLRNILGNGMSNKMWEGTVEHAKTCVLSGKLYVYYADDKQNIGVIFNNIFQLMGLIADGSYMSVDSLSDNEKVYVDKLVKVAYENWENVVDYDGEVLIGVETYPVKGIDSHTEEPVNGVGVRNPYPQGPSNITQQQSALPSSQSAPIQQQRSSTSSSGATGSGSGPASAPLAYRPEVRSGVAQSFPIPTGQLPDNHLRHSVRGSIVEMKSNREVGVETMTSISSSSQAPMQPDNTDLTELALGPPQSALTELTPAEWQQNPLESEGQVLCGQGALPEDILSQEEIHSRSMEFLENEDVQTQLQQLLRMFNDAGDTSESGYAALPEEEIFQQMGYPISAAADVTAGAGRNRVNGKAFVGWLKLKAALQWAIFIRKNAAARRAKLEESEG